MLMAEFSGKLEEPGVDSWPNRPGVSFFKRIWKEKPPKLKPASTAGASLTVEKNVRPEERSPRMGIGRAFSVAPLFTIAIPTFDISSIEGTVDSPLLKPMEDRPSSSDYSSKGGATNSRLQEPVTISESRSIPSSPSTEPVDETPRAIPLPPNSTRLKRRNTYVGVPKRTEATAGVCHAESSHVPLEEGSLPSDVPTRDAEDVRASRKQRKGSQRLLEKLRKTLDSSTQCDKDIRHAVTNGNSELLKALLQEERSEFDINFMQPPGVTLLHQACVFGNIEIVKLLLLNGADANLKTWSKLSPLDIAVSFGHFDVSKMLLKYGADPQAIKDGFRV